jgi:phospholipase C
MPDLTRRRLLISAAAAAGGAVASSVLPPGLRRALAEPPKRGSLGDIKHVVILMQENRSFDHYFGTLAGVRGFNDPDAMTLPNGRSIFHQPDPKNPDGYLLPFHLNTKHTSAQAIPSTSHAWSTQHAAWNKGKMDNWLPAHRKADGDIHGPYTMGHYTRGDIPFYFALAEAFTVCDRYHCSVLGPTWPNRIYHWSATIDPEGKHGGPINGNHITSPYRWTTYPERLMAADVSWHVYQQENDYGCNPLEFFQAYQDADPSSPLYRHGLTIGPSDQFEYDAAHDRLPTVSWIIPTAQQSEHPAYMPASGADFVARKLDAVAANPDLWAKTVFILNHDENDGLFDHVAPPTPPPGTPDEFIDGEPIGAGIRVPTVIVSPWTQGGWVSSEPFDHTSVLQFLERITGVREPNISAWRRRTFGDLTAALGVAAHERFPKLPPTKHELSRAEEQIAHLPPPKVPGAKQTSPHQTSGDLKHRAGAVASGNGHVKTKSRINETFTSHRHDFPDGPVGTIFPGIAASVMGRRIVRKKHVAYAYVCTMVGREIMVIDTSRGVLAGGLDAGVNPYGIAATPDKRKLYVTNAGESSVSVISPWSNTVRSSVRVGLYPHGIAISPDGRLAYVANTGTDTGPGGSRTVTVIGTTTDTVVGTIRVGQAPIAVAFAPDGASAYVTCADGVWAIDTTSQHVRAKLPVHGRVHGVAATPDGKHLYVVNSRRNTVSIVDPKRLGAIADIAVGAAPWNVAIRPDGAFAYITNANSDTVSVIDTARQKVTATIGVQHIPTGITANADTVWVSNNTSSTVQAIHTKTLDVAATVELGLSMEPGGIVLV